MQFSERENQLQLLLQELEKIYSKIKRIEIFQAVSHAYKKVNPFMHVLTNKEIEEIRQFAMKELNAG